MQKEVVPLTEKAFNQPHLISVSPQWTQFNVVRIIIIIIIVKRMPLLMLDIFNVYKVAFEM